MAIAPEKVAITPWGYCAEAEKDLRAVCNEAQLDHWFIQWQERLCTFWKLTDAHGGHVGTMVTWVDFRNDGAKEFIIGPVGGPVTEIIPAVFDFFEKLAGELEANRVRIDCLRPGLARLLEKRGFYQYSVTMHYPIQQPAAAERQEAA